jgi:NADPH:quinone reductase
VSAAAVSPTDTLRRAGAQSQTGKPTGVADVPGMDVAGTVIEVGEGVTHVAAGQAVVGIVVPDGEHGAYRTDLVLPGDSVAAAPTEATDAEASTLPMNGLTAMLALDAMGLSEGDTVAVTGAAGAFGGYVVQLAAARRLRVVADASEADEELVRALGADVVVRRGADVATAIIDAVPGGVDGLADGALLHELALPAVRPGGTMTTVRGWQPDHEGEVTVTPVMVRTVAERRDWLEELVALADKGQVTLRVADVLPAAEAPEAHRRLEAGGVRGRLVLKF